MNTSGRSPVRHVYVHAPFCARRCFYCDFAVTVRRSADPSPWAEALEKELRWLDAHEGIRLADTLDTVFVGGGTPSLLGPAAMVALRSVLGPGRLAGDALEWTSEANPESLTPEVAAAWRRAGLGRLSLGVQSFQEPVLRWMGRLHGAQGARAAVDTARRAGFENLSVDLIFGLPPALERDWAADLDAVLEMQLPHVSLYGLTAETGTPLGRHVSQGQVTMPADERYGDEFLEARSRLTEAGYLHYEVSNFALPGYESRHNQAYWRGVPYLGLGNSSHSFLPPVRRWNTRDWAEYRETLSAGGSPVVESEEVTGDSATLERVWLGLRTSDGLALEPGEVERTSGILDRWVRAGLAHSPAGSTNRSSATTTRTAPAVDPGAAAAPDPGASGGIVVTLTGEGWLLLDELAVELSGVL